MSTKATTHIELPEFVLDSIPDVPVEKKDFGSSVSNDIHAYTGLEGWPTRLYWKPSAQSKHGIVFSIKDNEEIILGKAQTPFSPLHNLDDVDEITICQDEKICEGILAPYLGKYVNLLSALLEQEKLRQETMICEFVIEIVSNLEKIDLRFILQSTGESTRKNVLDIMKRLFQRKCNEILN